MARPGIHASNMPNPSPLPPFRLYALLAGLAWLLHRLEAGATLTRAAGMEGATLSFGFTLLLAALVLGLLLATGALRRLAAPAWLYPALAAIASLGLALELVPVAPWGPLSQSALQWAAVTCFALLAAELAFPAPTARKRRRKPRHKAMDVRAAAAGAPPTLAADCDTRTLRRELAAQPGDLSLHRLLHERLLRQPDALPDLAANARQYIALLCRRTNFERALEIFRDVQARDAAFKPGADDIVPLARLALQHADYALAMRILERFDRSYPDHPATPAVYLLAATALLQLKRRDQAVPILEAILRRFPADPMAPEAQLLLDRATPRAAASL